MLKIRIGLAATLAVLIALSIAWAAPPERTANVHGAQPKPLARLWDVAGPGANAPILTTSLTLNNPNSALTVSVVLATSSVFNVTVNNDSVATDAVAIGLNESGALNAGDLYQFTFEAPKATLSDNSDTWTYNFQVETDGRITFLNVAEVIGEGR